ncbi:copper resistance protein NlpE [Algoriphagus sp. CAU 1675]|uniref:copper resistance protein NlpE n=1 Tax=Algoriphagus sp. CAU 1675 TaxID=3032597 RepID=UPI0023DBA848|nr:copper resistance protein NlpE [Algoriphagus sp. CAU 1675]MDF2156573.1 copper resistance protein NlpE [Algoriphagus sp. CAU 1675]
MSKIAAPLITACILILNACSPPTSSEKQKSSIGSEQFPEVLEIPLGDNSQNSLDWAGTYFAVLPCAHCEGIETWVTLNQDGTFELKTNYLGLNDALEEIYTGKFKWDETGSVVQFEGLIGNAPGKYRVGENQIWHLDKEGNRIEGELAERYILKKR